MKKEEIDEILKGVDKSLEKVKPHEIQKVKIITDPYDYSEPLNDNSSSGANQKKPDTPQIQLTNTQDREVRLLGLSIILDADSTKRAKLMMQIDMNQAPYGKQFKAGFFKNISSFAVPLSNEGHRIKPKETIDIYLWSTDGTDIEVAASAFVQARPQG